MLYKYLPYVLAKRLFGDRRRFGLKVDAADPDYQEFLKQYVDLFTNTQKTGLGHIIRHFGYQIIKDVDLTDKVVLEVGPGIIEHLEYNASNPKSYILADCREDFLRLSEIEIKKELDTEVGKILVDAAVPDIPLKDDTIDIIISFFQLEHIYALEGYLDDLKRVLKPGGLLAGAVPTEGGLLWGLGRVLTSRRFALRHQINYDKIICWEHPNFVDKIKASLGERFEPLRSEKTPFPFLPLDCNSTWSFIYRNPKSPAGSQAARS